ncbi:hypothetical protein M422DRAFT_46108 [Sphaerobolus stellatus SS14]|uniref:Uncharacterized protein n=1 Tax=Sphaerobolus stellatus (strain SS14) TaxID=990650 RepID=A0A0C9UUJ0_SPHS4|nr:hypothetical protein M422DRAFT_46108 [Sphaerobolus stellatus SS14]
MQGDIKPNNFCQHSDRKPPVNSLVDLGSSLFYKSGGRHIYFLKLMCHKCCNLQVSMITNDEDDIESFAYTLMGLSPDDWIPTDTESDDTPTSSSESSYHNVLPNVPRKNCYSGEFTYEPNYELIAGFLTPLPTSKVLRINIGCSECTYCV